MPFYEIHKRQQAERLADRRKNGLPQQTRIVTVRQAWAEANLLPVLHQLPQAAPLRFQDDAGNLAYLPGYDGPATPGQ